VCFVHQTSGTLHASGPQLVKPGTTHVAVGFLDLGTLAASLMAWPPTDQLPEGKPLRWVSGALVAMVHQIVAF
jgi:hypothetical protein